MQDTLRFRQIHLDFHTSPDIPSIGDKFDKTRWQDMLKRGHVDSVTTFAICHHGWAYYDTALGNRHPHLGFDLLRAQFEASKEIDVNVPIYITAGVNNVAAEAHPEWREIDYEGKLAGWTQSPLSPGFKTMCFNTPFLDYLCEQIREVVRLFPDCDGIFTDIIHQGPCCCQFCMKSMAEHGFDAEKAEDREAHAERVLKNYYRASTAAAKCDNPAMSIFHNSGHIAKGDNEILRYCDHLELESLPTGGWGYDHFPASAKYCTQLGKAFLGMTGKFHTTWGEFGGYKHPNALRYECASMLAVGAKCSVGDQLHPNGALDESTYGIIGAAYSEVEAKEPWCRNVTSVADIGLLSSTVVNHRKGHMNDDPADTGAVRLLLESQQLFDILGPEMDVAPYKMLILPDNVVIQSDLKEKLDRYLADGGKLMLTGDSGLKKDGSDFLFDVGATFEGKSAFAPDYVLPSELLRPEFVASPMVMYFASNRIKVTDGTSLGEVFDPYFNRTFRHFCSHQHTPYKDVGSGFDSGVLHGNILYLAHPVFTLYMGYGAVSYKDYVVKAIDTLLGQDRSVTTNLPSTARLHVMHQLDPNRYVLHLLHANTINRGGQLEMPGGNLHSASRSVEVIEDIRPLYNTDIELNIPEDIEKVTLEPQGKEIPFTAKDGRLNLRIDEFECHQMVVLHKEHEPSEV